MDAHAALDRIVADIARDLLDRDEGADAQTDREIAQAFHLAIGGMSPAEYEELLMTLPDGALRALAAAGYVTTPHLMYGCGVRGEVSEGAGGHLADVLVSVSDADVLERFVSNAWFGYAYGLSVGTARDHRRPVLIPGASRAAAEILQAAMFGAGFSPARARDVLAAAGKVVEDSAIDMPEAYVHVCATARAQRSQEPSQAP